MLRMLTWWDRPMGKRVLLEVKSFSILITGLSVFKAMADCSSEICKKQISRTADQEYWSRKRVLGAFRTVSTKLERKWLLPLPVTGFRRHLSRVPSSPCLVHLVQVHLQFRRHLAFNAGADGDGTAGCKQCDSIFYLVIPLSKRGNPRVL